VVEVLVDIERLQLANLLDAKRFTKPHKMPKAVPPALDRGVGGVGPPTP
jgi:hypothetical protein